MAGPIACLGYPSRTSAVLALRAQGLSSRQIAARIGVEIKTVTALEGSASRCDRPGSRATSAPTGAHLTIDLDTMRALRPHAARREQSVMQLAQELLRVLADDDLVDALLDDGAR